MTTQENTRYSLARVALDSIKYLQGKDYSTVFIGKDLDQNEAALNGFDKFEEQAKKLGAISGFTSDKKKAAYMACDYDVLVTDGAIILGVHDGSSIRDELLEAAGQTLKGWSAPITATSESESGNISEAIAQAV